MKRRLFTLSFLAICYTFSSLQGQVEGTIKLKNPSFEDYPRVSSAPSGWLDCGFPGETEADFEELKTFIEETKEFEPRHIDLRTFSLMGKNTDFTLKGGLTRVALRRGNLNSIRACQRK